MSEFVVAIPAGPSDAEAERARVLVDAVRTHEPRARRIVLVDDTAELREWPAGVAAIPNPRAGRGIAELGGTCTATLAALAWANANAPGAWVLRLEPDAPVVGPFADAIDSAWRTGDGVLGTWQVSADARPSARTVRKHGRRLQLWLKPPRRLRHVQRPAPVVRRAVRDAIVGQYQPGQRCVALGCAISAELIGRAAKQGWLDSPRAWLNTRLGDDIMLGIMARALWLDLRDLDGVFAPTHIGTADTPQALAAHG